LGPAYRTLLEWRRQSSFSMHELFTKQFRRDGILIAALFLFLFFLLSLAPELLREFELGPVWRDIALAINIVGVVTIAISMLTAHWNPPAEREPPPFEERVQSAIDRWRHMVPAMRELPD
jgi:hypothetical protein